MFVFISTQNKQKSYLCFMSVISFVRTQVTGKFQNAFGITCLTWYPGPPCLCVYMRYWVLIPATYNALSELVEYWYQNFPIHEAIWFKFTTHGFWKQQGHGLSSRSSVPMCLFPVVYVEKFSAHHLVSSFLFNSLVTWYDKKTYHNVYHWLYLLHLFFKW